MSGWAGPFGALSPDTTDTTDRTSGSRSSGAGFVDCVRCVGLEERGKRDRAALIARIVRAVAEALSAPDPDLARERAEIAAALATHAANAFREGAPPRRRRDLCPAPPT